MIQVTIGTTNNSYDVKMNKHDFTEFILGSPAGVIETKCSYYGRPETIYIKTSQIESITTEDNREEQNEI